MISLMEVFNLMGSLKLLSSVDLIEESTARFLTKLYLRGRVVYRVSVFLNRFSTLSQINYLIDRNTVGLFNSCKYLSLTFLAKNICI